MHLPIRSFVSESHRGDIVGNSLPSEGITISLLGGFEEPLVVEEMERETEVWRRHWNNRVRLRTALDAIMTMLIEGNEY